MNRFRNILIIVTLIIPAVFILTFPAFANSAEPPNLTVVVSFPPDGLELSVRYGDGSEYTAAKLERKGWESYYRFFSLDAKQENTVLIVSYGTEKFELSLNSINLSRYSNIITLDIESKSFRVGVSGVRTALLVLLRVTLTLLIEGAVFFMFGYRKRYSYIVFVIINLITQGLLNLQFSGISSSSGYWFIAFVILEILIFIAESVAFTLIIKEHKNLRTFLCVFIANTASLFAGGAFIAFLPL